MKTGPKFDQALAYAARIHRGQLRKGTGIPYISHLLAVTAIALEHGATETEAIGAVLHDAAEDAGGLRQVAVIRRKFGPRVAAIVAGCSDTFVTPKPPWEERKTAYLAHLKTASASVQLVSASDKLHNIRSIQADYAVIGEKVWQKFSSSKANTLWYYRSLASIYLAAKPRSAAFRQLAGKVDATVRAVHRAAGVRHR
jgi:(p)ppGpp synthase/HD superfamily hydrolase